MAVALAEQPAAQPDTAQEQPEPRQEPTPKPARPPRDYAAEFGRFATTAGSAMSRFGVRVARFGAAFVKAFARLVTFGWRIVAEIPPALRLFGALALSVVLSVFGSVTFDGALGTMFAVVLVPCFSLALGVVAHKWYAVPGEEAVPGEDAHHVARPTGELERSVEFVDTKLAFALNSFGTERHQQAVIALIQAKTATELARSTAPVAVPSARPRIRDGGTPTISRQVAAADPERS
ncbi:hypothetical protein [Mycolicibacterium vanbaalenii]|uniref:hypothetical protein n=1 Tax=Mycolicibacterium vanbaalenii TaxID=110539 RepID=UPI0013303CB5|nr:hypothetical protein [Mycolicibacterium vanbaalenii]